MTVLSNSSGPGSVPRQLPRIVIPPGISAGLETRSNLNTPFGSSSITMFCSAVLSSVISSAALVALRNPLVGLALDPIDGGESPELRIGEVATVEHQWRSVSHKGVLHLDDKIAVSSGNDAVAVEHEPLQLRILIA